MHPRNVICFRYTTVDTLHTGDNNDDDNHMWSVIRPVCSLFPCNFSWRCNLFLPPSTALRLSSSHLHLIPCLPVPLMFPSTLIFRWQFLCQMWPILLAFPLFYCLYDIPLFLSFLTLYMTLLHFSHHQSNLSSTAPHFKTSSYFLSTYQSVQVSTPHKAMFQAYLFLL